MKFRNLAESYFSKYDLPALPETFETEVLPYHPLSYYVAGGVSLNGELEDSAEISYDTEDDIRAGCNPDILCNPRSSIFDIVEQAGEDIARDVAREMKLRDSSPGGRSTPPSGEPAPSSDIENE